MLNERELEVLRLIGQAKSNREIAEELFLSVNSVKCHVRKAYRKIGIHSRSHAVLWAVHHGLSGPGQSPGTTAPCRPSRDRAADETVAAAADAPRAGDLAGPEWLER